MNALVKELLNNIVFKGKYSKLLQLTLYLTKKYLCILCILLCIYACTVQYMCM